MLISFSSIIFIQLICVLINYVNCLNQIVYAVNCGGEAHVDKYNIKYERDPLHGKIGTASDFGKRLEIGRVPKEDWILYQTERYHTNTFGYDIPLKTDGDYVLVLKFSEVYFNYPNQKVFDVVLNGDHTIVTDLDIYEKVGMGVAHDEYIPFSISNGKLLINEEESEIRGGKIRVEFIKGFKDNPKINAIFVMKGTIEDVPKLPGMPQEPEPIKEEVPAHIEAEAVPKNRRPSGPKMPDPYSMDDSSAMLPIFIAIGAFLPFLFCLCKL